MASTSGTNRDLVGKLDKSQRGSQPNNQNVQIASCFRFRYARLDVTGKNPLPATKTVLVSFTRRWLYRRKRLLDQIARTIELWIIYQPCVYNQPICVPAFPVTRKSWTGLNADLRRKKKRKATSDQRSKHTPNIFLRVGMTNDNTRPLPRLRHALRSAIAEPPNTAL